MESFRKWRLQGSLELCSYDCKVLSLVAKGGVHQLFIYQGCSERDGIDTTSSGSVSSDLCDVWRQGYLVSPQREEELELESASDYDNVNEEVGSFAARDHATESGSMDYISVVRETSLWILIRDCLCPARCIDLAHSCEKVEL